MAVYRMLGTVPSLKLFPVKTEDCSNVYLHSISQTESPNDLQIAIKKPYCLSAVCLCI